MSDQRRTISTGFKQLAGAVGPYGMFPLIALVAISAVERFDDAAFGVLGPEIRDAFHLSSGKFVFVATLTSVFPLFLSVPLGYLGDRYNRVQLSRLGGVVWGITAIGTGLSPAILILVFARLFGGVGLLVNEPVHASLLSDYYPPDQLPPVYAAYRLGSGGLALVGAPLAGFIGALFGWRAAFIVLAVPTFLCVAVMSRMREPARGGSLEVDVPPEEAGSMGEGFRRVRAIRSLRRTWLSAFFFGGGVIPFDNFLSLFFKDVYHLSPTARGLITSLFGIFGLVGFAVGGRWARREMARGNVEMLPIITGLMGLEYAVGIVLMAVVPNLWASIAAVGLLSIGGAGFLPSYQTMVALVSPPQLRSQAFAWSLLWYSLGAIVLGTWVGSLGDRFNQHVALVVLGILVAAAGLIEMTCRSMVRRDIENATAFESVARSDALLACQGLDVAYDQVQVLFKVDLEVHEGEIIALLGTNGAGKSTFLKAVSGLVDPIGGAIFCNGRDITHAGANATARLGIVQVPGGRGVFPSLTVAENLRVAAWMYRRDAEYVAAATERVLEHFPVLRERSETNAGSLSGGEQQMLSLGQAFIARPKLLLIDELSLGLSPVVVERLLDIVRAIHENGTTIILVEQSVNVALKLAQRAVFMEKGEIRFSGPTAELLGRTDILRAVFLRGAAESSKGGRPPLEHLPPDAGSAGKRRRPAEPDRRETPDLDRRAALLRSPAVLETLGISKRYGGISAVSGVDLTVHAGQVLGLIGPNGAGKTTIFDLICGFTPVDAGGVLLNGEDVTEWPAHRRAGAGLGRSFQDARLWPSLTVKEAITVGGERYVEEPGAVPALFGLPGVRDSEEQLAERAEELIELLGLGAFRDKFVAELSTGSRRMVEIAAVLAHRPSVLILDEPSSGIAQKETEALGPLLRAVQRHVGCSMLVIEHDMPLISGVADHLVALDHGQVLCQGVPADVLRDDRVVQSYLGTSGDELALDNGANGRGNGKKRAANKAGVKRRATAPRA